MTASYRVEQVRGPTQKLSPPRLNRRLHHLEFPLRFLAHLAADEWLEQSPQSVEREGANDGQSSGVSVGIDFDYLGVAI